MRGFFNLFGRSPFAPLQSHMQLVGDCVHQLHSLFFALEKGNSEEIERIAAVISEFEHQADVTKNDIRNHLPRSLFLPMDRNNLLEILSIQDKIADQSENVAVLTTLHPLVLIDSFAEEFKLFLIKNIESFDEVKKIIQELHDLIESSFAGLEAEKVRSMADLVAFKEHEADLLQRKLLKKFYACEKDLNLVTFHLWQRIFESLASISNLSENLANRVRMTLEIK